MKTESVMNGGRQGVSYTVINREENIPLVKIKIKNTYEVLKNLKNSAQIPKRQKIQVEILKKSRGICHIYF